MSIDAAIAGQLRKRLAVEKQKALDTITRGECSDYAEYRYACGYIKALNDLDILMGEVVDDIQKG